MVRDRLMALAIVAALVAPWASPCLAGTPDHAAMACCPRPATDAPLSARPCCGPVDEQPATPATASAVVLHAPQALCGVVSLATVLTAYLVRFNSKPISSADSRRLSTVLLI
jgi:hypothetical protein